MRWILWEAAPPAERRRFVADPAKGSRHNRGCAVDVTLHELASGRVVQMPSLFDEMSERAARDYAGGTATQRLRRDLLRAAMEREGFMVYLHEWWHFVYRGCAEHPILNIPFENLGTARPERPD